MRKWWWAGLMVVLMWGGIPLAAAQGDTPTPDPTAFDFYLQGNAHAAEGQYAQAVEQYTHALERDPNMAPVYFQRAYVYGLVGLYDWSIADYSRYLDLVPGHVDSTYNRGLMYIWRGDRKQAYDAPGAVQDYKQAVWDLSTVVDDLAPNDLVAHHDRSAAYYRLGEYRLAVMDSNWVIARDPGYVFAYHGRGSASIQMGDYEQAVADFTTIIDDLDPGYVDAYINRATAYFFLGEYERAIADWEYALALSPERGEVRAWMTQAVENMGYDRAVERLTRFLQHFMTGGTGSATDR